MPEPTRQPRRRTPRRLAAGVVALGIAGCAYVPMVELDRSSSARIAKVALLKIGQVPRPTVTNVGGGAGVFGLVGAAAQAGANARRGGGYADAVGERTAELAPDMTGALVDALTKGGYQVVTPDTTPTAVGNGQDVDLSSVQTDADAILAVWFTKVGYVSPPSSPNYRPWVIVKARMIDARSRRVLYFKKFSAGYRAAGDDSVYIAGGDRYRYASFVDLVASATESVDALVGATEAIASHLAADLTRK